MILQIKKYPDPILRIPGKSVDFPLSPALRTLIADMAQTVRAAKGIGLAAPQVGVSLRIVVINLEHLGLPLFALINPEIKKPSRKQTVLEEGCLSIPGVYGNVKRPKKIIFLGYDITGEKIMAEADGLLSKVLQHEIDHTNGILILDHITEYTKGEELINASLQ